MYGWGYNGYGQLGDGTIGSRKTPVQIGTATNWDYVACGTFHTLAIKTDGTLWAWGGNYEGQLGDGTTTNRTSPVQIGTATNWAQVACGYQHTLAIKTDGTLWAWGRNISGQLGDGTTTRRISPVQIGTATNWAQVACGSQHTLAIKTDGTLWAWGSNSSGELGDGTTTRRTSPIQIGTATNWDYVACGEFYTLAIKTDGTLWAWGSNFYGQLGDGTTTNRTSPVQIGTATNWTHVDSGIHTMALTYTTPTVSTASISGITITTATGGGEVTDDGGATVTARGICWNTTGSPTIADDFTNDGSGAGSFVSNITGLSQNTKYYVRAYATNSVGTAYGNEVEFTTIGDNINPTALCKSITIELNSDGSAQITAEDIDDGSNDESGIKSLEIDKSEFDCNDVGDVIVTLTVTDNFDNVSTCEATVTVKDVTPPTITLQEGNQSAYANSNCEAAVPDFMDGSAAVDNCSAVYWSQDPAPGTMLGLGEHTVRVKAKDASNLESFFDVFFTVTDNTAPTITVSVSPSTLWPPNNTMKTITATVEVDDNCSGVTYELTSITSNENISNDVANASYGTNDLSFDLRASRNGKGSGRVYTIKYTATDASGNTSTAEATVTVPHDQSKLSSFNDEFAIFNIYPNPAEEEVTIEAAFAEKHDLDIRLLDIFGAEMYSLIKHGVNSLLEKIDISKFPSGMYIIEIKTGGESFREKIIKH